MCAVVLVLDSRGHCLFVLKRRGKQALLNACSFVVYATPGAMLGCCNLFPVQSLILPEVDAHFHWAGQIGDKKEIPLSPTPVRIVSAAPRHAYNLL